MRSTECEVIVWVRIEPERVGLSREAVIADYGVVLTEGLDDDSRSHDAAATTNAARTSRPGPAGVLFDLGPGYARLPGGASYADVDVVGS